MSIPVLLTSLTLAVAALFTTPSTHAQTPAVEAAPAPRSEQARAQFDFWIGEWEVQNRLLQPDGAWADGGRARARIVPVLGGAALFEEWTGELSGAPMYGCSLRAFDPQTESWILLLNWPGGSGRSAFGTMRGSFRHGRGEFISSAGQTQTRYSFSDALPDTVRWDSATTTDGGLSWRTSWIMEFTRTRAANELGEHVLFAKAWDTAIAPTVNEARVLDFAVGRWVGTERRLVDGVWSERAARLNVAKIIRGHALIEHLELGPPTDPEVVTFGVRGWDGMRRTWDAWTATREQPVALRSNGVLGGGGVIFTDPDGERSSWTLTRDGLLRIETRAATSTGEDGETLVRTLEFERVVEPGSEAGLEPGR